MNLEDRIKNLLSSREESMVSSEQMKNSMQSTSMIQASYSCEECKDTTFIPGENGMIRCKCFERDRIKRLWDKAGLNPEQKARTIDTFQEWNRTSKMAKRVAVEYIKDFESIKDTRVNSIAFIGQVGSGKTHLSISIALNLLERGIGTVYMPYRDEIMRLKQNSMDEAAYQRQISVFKRAKVLLIDDLFKGDFNKFQGRETANESSMRIMFEIINHRYLNNLPIIVSSEYSADKLLDADEGIGSRIIEMTKNYLVEIEGRENNYRLK